MIDTKKLRAGDIVHYTGVIYTARDAAHNRIKGLIDEGKELPVDFTGSMIYYAGPTPTKPNGIVGSIGPTTSSRMDKFIHYMPKLGIIGMIGKGPRSEEVRLACKEYGLVYLVATGGAGALLSKRVKSCKEIAFEDLGCESIKRLEVEDFPLIVYYDSLGNEISKQGE